MSWFDKNSSSLIGSAGSLIGGIVSYFGNKSLQKESNEFNAQQAELNRQFQHQETELARDWQEKFYNQYQSPGAMVRQYENAGINPVLAAGQPTNTPPAASGGAGSSASSVTPPYMNMVGVMEQVGKLAMLKAEIANINADTRAKEQSVFESISREDLNRSYQSLNTEQINDVIQSANLKAAQASTESAKKEWYIAEKAFKVASQKQIDLQNAVSQAFKDATGVDAPADMISSILGKCIEVLGELPQTFFKFARKSKTTSKVKGGK